MSAPGRLPKTTLRTELAPAGLFVFGRRRLWRSNCAPRSPKATCLYYEVVRHRVTIIGRGGQQVEMIVSVLSIAGAVALGAMSPGPSFVMVARTAVASSRTDGFAAALGMGVGAVLFAGVAVLGLHMVLSAVPWVYLGLKVLGGAYLIYLGGLIWRDARKPVRFAVHAIDDRASTVLRSFWLGLLTQVSNPKTAVFYASIFVSLLPREVPLSVTLILPPLIFVIEAGWYSIVALAMSASSPRAAYLRAKAWIDRAAGGVMTLLGIKLIVSTKQV